MTHFKPADEAEHAKGNAGKGVPDYCANCRQPFMSHYNGACPQAVNRPTRTDDNAAYRRDMIDAGRGHLLR